MITAAELATIIQSITPLLKENVRSAIAEATAPLLERTASLEAQVKAFEPARHGRDGVDGKNGVDGKDGTNGRDGKDGAVGERGKDGREGIDGKDGAPGLDGKDGRDGRDGMPGQPGERGKDGRDGLDGKNGADALGFDDLSVEPDGERGILIKFQRGDRIKSFLRTFDIPLDRGVYQAARAYHKGDGVTYAGCFWIAQAATSAKPGDGEPSWRLAVKAGRDGKQGPAGENGKDGINGKDGLSWR